MFKLYERKRIGWLGDVEEARERSVCHIETIENSVIVSPSTDWTNFTAGKAGNSEKLERRREGEEEEEERRRERRRGGEEEERNDAIYEKPNRETSPSSPPIAIFFRVKVTVQVAFVFKVAFTFAKAFTSSASPSFSFLLKYT